MNQFENRSMRRLWEDLHNESVSIRCAAKTFMVERLQIEFILERFFSVEEITLFRRLQSLLKFVIGGMLMAAFVTGRNVAIDPLEIFLNEKELPILLHFLVTVGYKPTRLDTTSDEDPTKHIRQWKRGNQSILLHVAANTMYEVLFTQPTSTTYTGLFLADVFTVFFSCPFCIRDAYDVVCHVSRPHICQSPCPC
jgi:hypothetical protein